jgi:hypothetical protein
MDWLAQQAIDQCPDRMDVAGVGDCVAVARAANCVAVARI